MKIKKITKLNNRIKSMEKAYKKKEKIILHRQFNTFNYRFILYPVASISLAVFLTHINSIVYLDYLFGFSPLLFFFFLLFKDFNLLYRGKGDYSKLIKKINITTKELEKYIDDNLEDVYQELLSIKSANEIELYNEKIIEEFLKYYKLKKAEKTKTKDNINNLFDNIEKNKEVNLEIEAT